MKKLLVAAMIASVLAPTMAEAKKDSSKKKEPIVATVNGHDVTLSEFEYLYHKNNSQQAAPQSLDEYLDMFIVYKLKVADAEAEGIDTTAKFRREYNQYVTDLATPYLRDDAMADSLLRVAYQRKLKERKLAFIQLKGGEENFRRLDSIRGEAVAGGDFAELAAKYSIDPNAGRNGGVLGWVGGGMIPIEIEDQMFATPIGDYSPVFETRYGVLLVHPTEERDNRGERQVRHILKLTQGKDEAGKAKARHDIDSLLNVVKGGADFAEVAKAESEDPGSRDNGGLLPWFGSGRMVPEFEAASFSLTPGQISDVVETSYGYHIIKSEGERQPGSFEDERAGLETQLSRDGRAKLPVRRVLDRLQATHPVVKSQATRDYVKQVFEKSAGIDTTALKAFTQAPEPAATIGNDQIPLKEVGLLLLTVKVPDAASAMNAYDKALDETVEKRMMQIAIDELPSKNDDFRNLINEYRDGILLYEVSNNKVWNRANTDTEGLQKYFEANKANYTTWTEPRYKGYVMLCAGDSVANVAKAIVDANPGDDLGELKKKLKDAVGNNVRMEKVLAKKGDNAVVDYAAFGGAKPAPRSKWSDFFIFNGKMIDQPEEATDVKGAVSSDWQKQLETDWVDSLHKTYPVKINQKVVKKVK